LGYFNPWSFVVGLVVPFIAVVGGVAVLGGSPALVLGMPVVYFWIFLWFFLTSACLAASWYFFDRDEFSDEGAPEEEGQG